MVITSKKGVSITHHPNCKPALTTDLWTFLCYLKELEIGKKCQSFCQTLTSTHENRERFLPFLCTGRHHKVVYHLYFLDIVAFAGHDHL